MKLQRSFGSVLIACPDSRPPAYQAVIGLEQVRKLRGFVTACYYNPAGRFASLYRRLAPGRFSRLEQVLLRRYEAEICPTSVQAVPSFDLLLQLEARLGKKRPKLSRVLARYRTERFDDQLARTIDRIRPELLVAFSDVGSISALPLCRRLGIKTIVSMVHGDVREEQQVLEREDASSPEFMPIYLGSSNLDRTLLAWLYQRRLRDLALADRVLVPSDHIAETLARHGTSTRKNSRDTLCGRLPSVLPARKKTFWAGLHVPFRGRCQSSQGHQVSAGSVATNPSSRLAAAASRSTTGGPRPAGAVPEVSRAAWPSLSI